LVPQPNLTNRSVSGLIFIDLDQTPGGREKKKSFVVWVGLGRKFGSIEEFEDAMRPMSERVPVI
jgi:hypothetical protein